MPTLENPPVRADHGEGALLGSEFRVLLDPVERIFARSFEDGKHRLVLQVIDRVVAPLAFSDHAAVDPENGVEFATVKGDG